MHRQLENAWVSLGNAMFCLEMLRRLDRFAAEISVRTRARKREALRHQEFLPHAHIGTNVLETQHVDTSQQGVLSGGPARSGETYRH